MDAVADEGVISAEEDVSDSFRPNEVLGPTSRQLLFLTGIFWAAVFSLAELRSVVDHSVKLQLYTLLRIVSATFGAAECYAIHRFAGWLELKELRWRAFLVIALGALAGLVNLKAIDALQNLSIYPVSDYGLGWRIYNATYWAMLFMAWSAMYLALSYNRAAVVRERQARRLERLAHDAQLRALRLQVDPHFLFNTLNSVSALVLNGRNDDAERMIDNVAEFFRLTLRLDASTNIALSEEVAVQKAFLDIERVRFPDLEIEVDVHPEAGRALIPVLLLQPLVENAVKFARGGVDGAVRIGIRAPAPVGERVTVEVWDEGPGVPVDAKGTGTGLRNVAKRLHLRFGADADLRLLRRQPMGVRAVLSFPTATSPTMRSPTN